MAKKSPFPFDPADGRLESALADFKNLGIRPSGRKGKPPIAHPFQRYRYLGVAGSDGTFHSDLIGSTNQEFVMYCQEHQCEFSTTWRKLFNGSEKLRCIFCPFCADEMSLGRNVTTLKKLLQLINENPEWPFELADSNLLKKNEQTQLFGKDRILIRCTKKTEAGEYCSKKVYHSIKNILYALRHDYNYILCQGDCDSRKKGKAKRLTKEEFDIRFSNKTAGQWQMQEGQRWLGISKPYWFEHIACGYSIYILPNQLSGQSGEPHKCPVCDSISPLSIIDDSVASYRKWVSLITLEKIEYLAGRVPSSAEEKNKYRCQVCGSEFRASQDQIMFSTHHGCAVCARKALRCDRVSPMDCGCATRRGFAPLSELKLVDKEATFVSSDGKIIKTSLLELCREFPLWRDGFKKKTSRKDEYEHTRSGVPFSEFDTKWLIDHANTMSYLEMGKVMGRSAGSIKQKFRRESLVNNRRENYKRLHSLDDHAFDEITPNSAYWAGLLAADGCLSSRRKEFSIELKAADELHLGQFLSFLKYDNCLSYRCVKNVCSRNIYAGLRVSSVRIYDKLQENFGLTPSKTLSLLPPNIKDESCKKAYLLGYLDGDGYVKRTKGVRRDLQIGICSASPQFIRWIVAEIEKIVGKTGQSICTQSKSRKNTIYSTTLHTKEAKKFMENLYASVDLGFERKKSVFLSKKY
jgi:hypothetical protein